MERRRRQWVVVAGVVLGAAASFAGAMAGGAGVPTTLKDFFQPGSQPNGSGSVQYDIFRSSGSCELCHGTDAITGEDLPILPRWQGSMMAQAARDPLFFACLAIANQDAAFAGDLCLRCHTPGAWIDGRSEPPDGSRLGEQSIDFDGVSCTICHRMLDPVFQPGISPPVDESILADIHPLPSSPGGANFVFDPMDFRRGPYGDPASPPHTWIESPFHRSAALCGTCHDVSNPVYRRRADGTYELTALDTAHPTADKYDMFPLERTYSEWLNSEFAAGGVDMGGRFGGTKQVVGTCQDCHMPTLTGKGAFLGVAPIPERTDLKAHDFAGGNAWVQDMILNLYPNDGLDPGWMQDGMDRSRSMLQRACTLEVAQEGNHVRARVYNETGHKLPSGYPEGRRMWIHVSVLDAGLNVVAEYGHYDGVAAELTKADTTVFEAELGVDATIASAANIPAGKGFHFALNNVIFKDNRIPPRGYSYGTFRAVQAAPVGVTYLDGQYWHDSWFRLPQDAASVTVEVLYQTSSKEYITFLRDENVTDLSGQVLYDEWVATNMSPPALMASLSIPVAAIPDGDFNGDTVTSLADFASLSSNCMNGPGVPYPYPACVAFDFDADGDVDARDFAEFAMDFDGP